MQYLLTEEEHNELTKKARLVSVYAEEIKRLTGITDNNTFSKYAQELIYKKIERDRAKYHKESQNEKQ